MNRYNVYIDGQMFDLEADSLAAVANKVREITKQRDTVKRIKIWSPAGIMLVDTNFGDVYDLLPKS